ncbi:MAG: SDR family NAD(P)-dependent oxidoreductase [Pseudomonadota bacterium]
MGAYRIPRWISRYWKDPPSNDRGSEPVGQAPPEPIAVVGMSAALPMAVDLDAFWDNLLAGRDCIAGVPSDRQDWASLADDPVGDEVGMRSGGFIEGVEQFDSLFFNISPREAALMDPHQRLLMMHAWRTIEDAGYAPRSLAGTDTGVFVGIMVHDYVRMVARADRPAEGYTSTGMLSSITANRISHFLDLRGPNEAIDTACSSSLVALHRAVRAIQGGECELALAGGAHLLLTPYLHASFGRAGMLSKDGRCKTFSSEANGYVRSEGVGLVLLKRLSAAERDRDHIHCVIRSTVENHGGAARSLTAPNPRAQADLVYRAYASIDAHPSTIGYIECHGTGTPLGDPIEVEALKSAFDRLHERHGTTSGTAYCGLGSVKGNIGHLEIAAGIAGLMKVVLQLRHGTLVPSLHSRPRNPYVVTDDTPFYIVEEARPWPRPSLPDGEAPRRAGVSSFGFGGVNAHVVVEEHMPSPRPLTGAMAFPILLSARTATALQRQVAALLGHVEKRSDDAVELLDASWTLACGREAMSHRLGFVVDSRRTLIERLTAIRNGDAVASVSHGHVDTHRPPDAADAPSAASLAQILHSQVAAEEAVACWVRGGWVDWPAAFAAEAPHRCSLPGYVFDMLRFPLPHPVRQAPSVHRQGSSLRLAEAQVVSRRIDAAFDGDERFLMDHRIDGVRLLPAVMSLELARAAHDAIALRGDAGRSDRANDALRFEDVRWRAPFAAAGPATLSVWLHAQDTDGVRFEIGLPAAAPVPDAACVTGRLRRWADCERPRVALEEVRARCRRASHAAEACYDAFARIGFAYGDTHRTIRELRVGDGELIAELALPAGSADREREFVLDPAILDGALQAVVGFHMDAETAWRLTSTSRPAACARVDVFHASPDRGWAIARLHEQATDDAGGARRFDIDLCDRDGALCVRFVGLTIAGAAGAASRTIVDEDGTARELFVAPAWIPVDVVDRPDASEGGILVAGGTERTRSAFAAFAGAVRFLPPSCETDEESLRGALEGQDAVSRIVWLVDSDAPSALDDDGILEAQSRGVFRCLTLARGLLAAGYGDRPLDWLVVTRDSLDVSGRGRASPVHAGLQGMIGAIAREHPHWRPRLLDIPGNAPLPLDALLRADFAPGPVLAYRNRRWRVRRLCPVDPPPSAGFAIAPGSVCLIVGGAGGLGRVFSEALLRHVPDLQLVWMGRRPRASVQSALDDLALLGRPVHYIQGDAADSGRLAEVRLEIETRFGRVDGLIHAAMVLADRSIERLSDLELRAALSPKVDACVRLAQAFDPDRLAFALFFSSINAFATLAGQGNYAAASCFEDAFALAWGEGARGRIRIVNWGYWGEVGAVATDFHRMRMTRAGFASIRAPEAVSAALRILSAPLRQYGYLRVCADVDLEAIGIDPAFRLDVSDATFPHDGADRRESMPAEIPSREIEAMIADGRSLDLAIVEALYAQLSALCPFDPPRTREAATMAAGIVEAYRPWFRRSVDELVDHGYLEETNGLLRPGPEARGGLAVSAAAIRDRLPAAAGNPALRDYVGAMLEALPGIVAGRLSAVDVAFSEPTSTWAADSYFNDPAVRHGSVVVADLVAEEVARRAHARPGARVRLLEVGAGRGATTRHVVRALVPHAEAIAEYTFTDISAAFIGNDRRVALDFPAYVAYRTFDVERDPAAQGLDLGAYDIVIAANVLHATEDLERTLRHCKALLARGGILLLQELTGNPLYAHVTYGLLEGWWRFADSWLRVTGGPAASPEAWAELLALCGFREVRFPAPSIHPLWHQVVYAESDGVGLRPVSGHASTLPAPDRVAHGTAGEEAAGPPVPGPEAADSDGPALRMDAILSQLKTVASEVLGVEESVFDDASQPFAETLLAEYGMDSLSSINLRNALRSRYGIDVPTQQLLGEKTSVIADAIYNQLLMQRLVSRDAPADDAPSETFVF